MLTNITKSWKSTLAGVALAVFQVVVNGRDTKTLLLAVVTAALAAVCKDPNSAH